MEHRPHGKNPKKPGTKLQVINQGKYGGYSMKPTTMLVCAQPAFEQIHQARRVERTYKKKDCLQGKEKTDKGMQYKTARAKEYPSPLCALFAASLLMANKREPCQRNQEQSEQLIQLCMQLREKENEMGQDVQMGKDYATHRNEASNRSGHEQHAQPKLWLPAYPSTDMTYLTKPNYIWGKTISEAQKQKQKSPQTETILHIQVQQNESLGTGRGPRQRTSS